MQLLTPMTPDPDEREKWALDFSVLSDQDARVAKDCEVTWEIPERIL